VAAYDEALRHKPGYPPAHLGRAEALFKLRQQRAALDALDAYFDNGGKPVAAAYQVRGLARSKLGRYPDALQDLSRALDFDPKDAATRAERGWVYLACDAPQLARADFEEVIRLRPADADAYNGLGYALVKLGEVERAVRAAEDGAARAPRASYLQRYEAARVVAQAAGRLDADATRSGRPAGDRRSRYEERAVGLLGEALRLCPAAGRARFWRERVFPDAALYPIRAHPRFKDLGAAFARAERRLAPAR
jgi:tetratricopeptide (TPR) repeat protein